MKSLACAVVVIDCILLISCHRQTQRVERLHSNTNVSTFSAAECDLMRERIGWMTNRDFIRIPKGMDTERLPRPVQEAFASRVDQTQKGAAFISLLALSGQTTVEARPRIAKQVKEMSWRQLWDSTADYINAEINGASSGSYVSQASRPPKGAEFLETVESFYQLNSAYFKDVRVGSGAALPRASVDALDGADLRSQASALLDKASCR